MLSFESHSYDSIDVEELATFTHHAYSLLPIPYKYGTMWEEITFFLSNKENCPDFIALAREDGTIRGWAGVYHWTDSIAYFLSWHPLVIPPDLEIAQQLVRACIQHTVDSNRNRMEVFLTNLTDEYQDYAAVCGAIYRAAGMTRGYEWAYMEANLQRLDFSLRAIPETMTLCSLAEVSNDALWSSYDAAFSKGSDRRYIQQSETERRENFETFFSRQVPIDEAASLVLFDSATIVGFVKIDIISEGTYIHGVGVIPAYRRQGYGKFILGTSLRRASENHHKKMILEVDVDNQAALGLYRSLGFQQVKGSVSYTWEA
ncbi:MAG: GNAT family N-acetyltransferase [Anaerolineae bacterium]|nr:GNAT family N-acetyltransferase [Anaerolineae bacterium]